MASIKGTIISLSVVVCVPTLKADTHQADIKKLASTKTVTSRHICLSQKVVLEHTTKTTPNSQLALTFCTYLHATANWDLTSNTSAGHLKSYGERHSPTLADYNYQSAHRNPLSCIVMINVSTRYY